MHGGSALLLVDIVDSTALTQTLGEVARENLWDRHDRGARDLFGELGGTEIDKTDGFLLLFESAASACQFVSRYFHFLQELEPPLKARGAMHVAHLARRRTPDADVARGAKPIDIDGLVKAIVARVISVAAAGQILLTDAAAEALRSCNASIASVGHWRMKGLTEPLALFELVVADDGVDEPLDSEKAHRVARHGDTWLPVREIPNSLPLELTTFVGRRALLLSVQRSLEGRTRLLTLHGPGGIGKTRLAIHAAWSNLGAYSGGVWFCDLSAATSLDGVLYAVASGLRLPPSENADPIRVVRDALVGRGHCLLVLDNFEQVAPYALTTLGNWLEETTDAHFLVTSRVALKLPGEHLYELESLSEAEALELLLQRGKSVRADFSISHIERVHACKLLSLLDHLPLAIELAASRLNALSVSQLLERMSQRFRLLAETGGRGTRHSALRATLEWSWELLTGLERHAFAAVSVFEAGFTLQAFEAVVQDSTTELEHWPLDLLQALVDKSLLRRLQSGRYEMLYSIREFAAEKLDRLDSSDSSAVRDRHAEHFGSLDPGTSRRLAAEEIENIVAATRWAWRAQREGLLLRLLDLAWLGLQSVGPFRVALSLADPVLQRPFQGNAARAMASFVAGSARKMMGDATRGEELLQSAVELSDVDVNPRVRILALCALYDCLIDRGEIDAAFRHLGVAERLADDLASDQLRLLCMNSKAAHYHQAGDLAVAWTQYQAALSLAHRIDDRRWQGGILGNLGNICQAKGDLDRAADLYRQALRLSVDERDRRWAVNTQCNLGVVHHELGQPDDALALLRDALSDAEAIGSLYAAAVIECNLGIVHNTRASRTEATNWFDRFHRRAQSLGHRGLLTTAQGYLAVSVAGESGGERSRALMKDAIQHRETLDATSLAILSAQRAELALLLRDNEATKLLVEAEAAAGDGTLPFEVSIALSAARSRLTNHSTPNGSL